MNVFDLFATLTLDDEEYRKKLNEDEDEASGHGSRIGAAFGAAGKAVVAGLTAAAAGVGFLVKSAIGAYANYEQLVGGIETLFSSLDGSVSAASEVMTNAANAYKTAGMSANQYMETVTSFSAALVSSLDGDYSKAAAISDMAITDMADNANKMGTSMESIQMAYQGFAKQNYTMLDNLKLGYGGTKTEMERLLADAEKITGVHYDISNLSDVYEAIHVIQGEVGITGTTAEEAAKTISGSTAMMKASFANLMVGIADDSADFDALVSNFVDSVATMAGNILPRISSALQGVGKLIGALAPQIASAIPMLITQVLPALMSSAATLLNSFGNAILQNLPTLIESALQIVLTLAQGVAEALPELVPVVVDIMLQIVDTLIENIDLLIDAALQIMIGLAEGIVAATPELLAKAPEIIAKLVTALAEAAPQLLSAASTIISTIASGIASFVSNLASSAWSIITTIASGIAGKISDIYQAGIDIINKVIEGAGSIISTVADIGSNIVEGIWNGISAGYDWIVGKISGWVDSVIDFIKNALGISSPSKVMRDQVGKFMAQGIGAGFVDEMARVEADMQSAIPKTFDVGATINASGYASAYTTTGGDFVSEIRGLREDIRNLGIYLDTGVLVGAINDGLGQLKVNYDRRQFA